MVDIVGTLISGVNGSGTKTPIRVDNDGQLVTTGGGGGVASDVEVTNTPGVVPVKFAIAGLGSQKLTVDGTVRALTVPTGSKHMHASLEGTTGEALRYKVGSNPSGTDGVKVGLTDYFNMMDPLMDYASVLAAIRFIRVSTNTADVILNIEYFT